MKDRITHRLAPLTLLSLLAIGCSDATSNQTALVSLALTDQPGDVDRDPVDRHDPKVVQQAIAACEAIRRQVGEVAHD